MSESISIVCFLWGEDYLPEHVNLLYQMIQKNINQPYRFICITEKEEGFCHGIELFKLPEEIETFLGEIPAPKKGRKRVLPSSYRRLWLFSKEAEVLGERLLVLDVDCVITGALDILLERKQDFVAWTPNNDYEHVKRLQKNMPLRVAGGTWLLRTGTHAWVWDDFSLEGVQNAKSAGWRGSDQAWMSYCLSLSCTRWERDLIYNSQDGITKWKQIPKDAVVIHFNGVVKPWHDKAKEWVWYQKFLNAQSKTDMLSIRGDVSPQVNIVLFWWGKWPNGDFDLGIKYINDIVDSIKENISGDTNYKIILFTDMNITKQGVEIKQFQPKFRWNLNKMHMYSKGAGLEGPVLCLDLDCLIVGSLDPILKVLINAKKVYKKLLYTCEAAYQKGKAGGSVVGFWPAKRFNDLFWRPLLRDKEHIEEKTKGSERVYYRDQYKKGLMFWESLLPNNILSYKRDCVNKTPHKDASIIRFHGKPRPHEIPAAELAELRRS